MSIPTGILHIGELILQVYLIHEYVKLYHINMK